MRKFCIILVCFVFSFALALPVYAAAPTGDDLARIQRQQEQLIIQQEERRRELEQQFMHRERQRESEQPQHFEREEEKAGDPCMQVNDIRVEGVTVLSQGTIDRILAPHTNQCLSITAINNVLRNITNEYIDRGYVTTRAFIKPDTTAPNTLDILVLEGKIEKILLNDGEFNYIYRGRTAFPLMEGTLLNLRDIEQGLDQLNRLPSQDATMELEPVEEMVGTIVKVTVPHKRSWRMGGGMDNLGQRSSGQWQYNVFFEKDNPIGLGEQVGLYFSQDAPFLERPMENRRNEGHNQSFSGFFSIPIGYWTLSANISHFEYENFVDGMFSSYTFSGKTDTSSGQIERVIHRDADSKTSLGMSVTHREVKNYIEGIRLFASSYTLTTLTSFINHNRRFLGGSLGATFEHVQGLPFVNPKPHLGHNHATPKGYFHKFSGNMYWYRPFSLFDASFFYQLSANGQLTSHTLFGAERISIGGKQSVRGFHEESATGDQGGYVRNELGWNIPWLSGKSNWPFYAVQLYGAYDAGRIIQDKEDPFERGRLEGVSVGLRTTGDLAFDLTLSKPLTAPEYIKKRDMEVYFSLRYSF